MVFPATILDLQADVKVNAAWNSVTTYVYSERQKPAITRGRPDESSGAVASAATFQLNNQDFRFSPHNPLGAYYPYLGRNTQFRMHVPEATNYLRLEGDNVSSVSTPTAAALNLGGNLEARIDLNLTNFTPVVLAKKWSDTANNFSWAWLLNANGKLSFYYSTDGSTIRTATSSVPLPWPGGRISLKVTYTTGTGAVAFFYATTIGGSYIQIGATVTGTGTGVLFAGNAALQVGQPSTGYFAGLTGFIAGLPVALGNTWAPANFGSINGKVYEFQLRNGIAGSLVADPVFSSQAAGATSFADAQANTWTLNGTAEISSRKYRCHGEIAEWPQAADESQRDVYTTVQANGLLRRLSQNTVPLQSALRRAWSKMTGTFAPVAYWPCEDGNAPAGTTGPVTAQPTQIASGLPSGKPMGFAGSVTTPTSFASDSGFICSDSLPVPGTQSWYGPVPSYTLPSLPAVVVPFLLHIPSGGDADGAIVVQSHQGGTFPLMQLVYNTAASGTLTLKLFDESNAATTIAGTTGVNGQLLLVQMSVLTTTGGVNVQGELSTLLLGAVSAQNFTSTAVAGNVGRAYWVKVNPNGTFNHQSAVGHIAVQSKQAAIDSVTLAGSLIAPFNAWNAEPAALRFARLCTEQGYTYRILGSPSASLAMGPQGIATFQSLLQECEAADHGMIFEPRQVLALGYRTSASMTVQGLALSGTSPLALSYTGAALGGGGGMALQATDDDQLTLNDEIVTRGTSNATGTSFELAMAGDQFAANSGLSTQPPTANPPGVGVYQDARTVNIWSELSLGDQAGWIVHLGTVNELRYPAIPVDLARSELTALLNAIQDLDLGDYVSVTSPPTFLTPDTIKAIIWGLTETLGGYIFTINWQTTPESPYEILVAGSGAGSDCRADTDGSTLASPINTVVTSLNAISPNGIGWSNIAGDFPYDIIIGGERMTVTAAGSPITVGSQGLTVTRSVNGIVKAHSAGEAIYLFQPCYYALV
jgi:hypothetical protein